MPRSGPHEGSVGPAAVLLHGPPRALGSPEDGPRVVFIVDLWHPNVAGAERQALDFVFAPDP